MPAGTSWPRYMGAVIGAMLSMLAGAQTVHLVYKPLEDLNSRVEEEKEKRRKTRTLQETSSPAVASSSSS